MDDRMAYDGGMQAATAEDEELRLDEARERDRREREDFDPAAHITNLGGRGGRGGDYLEVKWRLVWLRAEHPDAEVVTEFANLTACDYDRGPAIFKATVTIPGGKGSATGWGSESAGDFRDFIEKAETKAIGRALAALGYGTQFTDDHEAGRGAAQHQEGRSRRTGEMRIADAPVDFTRRNAGGGGNGQRREYAAKGGGGADAPATDRQVQFAFTLGREAGLDEAALGDWSREMYGKGVVDLNRRDMSAFIEALQRRRQERG